MIEMIENGTKKVVLKMSGSLTIEDIGGIRESILKSIGSDGHVLLKGRGIKVVDISLIQLIFSLRKALEAAGRSLEIEDDGTMLRKSAEEAGLSHLFLTVKS